MSELPLNLSAFPVPIIHIDCDAFFTSVEQALKPELRGKPVVTGKERGIVACASYEAKALGVRRPMSLLEAKKALPELICLPSDYETYSIYSRRMFSIIRRFTPHVEEYSIDEAFAELSGLRRIYRTGYAEIAWQIKQAVQKELGLTVSVGLSASKTLAKIASKEKKPDGFTVVPANELHHFLKRIPLERVCGFGPNSVALLEKNGLRNVYDYIARPEGWAHKLLGKIGTELWHELRGEAVYPFVTEEKEDYLSISKMKTFTPASGDIQYVRAQLLRNLESAMIKLRRHNLRARLVGIYLRSEDFRSSGIEAELERSTRSTLEISDLVSGLLDKIFRHGTLYRLTGVFFSKIQSDAASLQYGLFEDPARVRALRAIDRVIDGANELYGKHALHLGTSLWLGRRRRSEEHFGKTKTGFAKSLGQSEKMPAAQYHLSTRGDLPQRKMDLLRGESFRRRLAIPMWNVKV